ncbi:hypothetical protein [Cellulosimicrobium arenosum]|uniref:Uncharacterized protein n=1 Tax=Cellulosimicrobium arenosum TaxID=2708133 RepID=A0A927G7X1_9MICO|nr:hypothetical protein [Cellulosimicrobium arenosum]MBD8078551.1 hypothetical protein [Cellulosimicrobium arenosum]
MTLRFVPPPGWRTPAGFTPTDDWHPDPSWPAAPAGWVFWVDDAVPPAPMPTRRSLRQEHPVTATTVPDAAGRDPHPVVGSTMVLPALVGAQRTSGTVAATAPAQQVGPLSLPGADDDAHEPGRARRWIVPAASGLAGVATGLLVGIGLTLTAQGDAQEATADAERVQEEVAAEREQLESERADLEAQQDDLDAANGELEAREQSVEQAENEAQTRSDDLDERAAQQQRDQDLWNQQRDERERNAEDGGQDGQGGGQEGQGGGQDDGAWWDWNG